MLNQTQSQKLSHKMLPKIVLTQNILAIPTLALDNIIKRELELNPMLEEGNEFDTEEELEQTEEDESVETIVPKEDKTEDKISDEILITPEDNANLKDEDNWDEYFENEQDEVKFSDGGERNEFESNFVSDDNKSLNETLMLQLNLSGLNEKLIFMGEELIWSLNDSGYFVDNPEDILSDVKVKKIGTKFESEDFSIEELNETLIFLQKNIDPPGIAARNLTECLVIQIERSNKDKEMKELSKELVEKYFADLKLKRYEKISKDLNIDLAKVKEVFEFIHKLNPKPGSSASSNPENYIVPDLIVKKDTGSYEIFLNERYSPSIRINRAYKNLYTNEKKSLDSDTKEYIINNFNRAKWFIDAINSRRETMLKIMEAIIKRQTDFFDNNGEGLKPIYEKDVAEDIRMDKSTISRAVRGKYVQTDFGIYELRSFFTTPLSMMEGEDVSNVEVKIKLKELIQNENKSNPLTDEELGAEMNRLGFKIARRTVAKYRESINIPVAKLRREI
ncbi:MAG: RNA polymerase factor sigma-54 [bacterium]